MNSWSRTWIWASTFNGPYDFWFTKECTKPIITLKQTWIIHLVHQNWNREYFDHTTQSRNSWVFLKCFKMHQTYLIALEWWHTIRELEAQEYIPFSSELGSFCQCPADYLPCQKTRLNLKEGQQDLQIWQDCLSGT